MLKFLPLWPLWTIIGLFGLPLQATEPTATPAALCQEAPTHAPDILEDNWDAAHATTIAPGLIYDLNLHCPADSGCPGGDHDYLRLPVKAGVEYIIATFDLGPATDTVLELFWGDNDQPAAANDDVDSHGGLHSLITWQAPDNGMAIIRIAPRYGGNQAQIAAERFLHYRFAAAISQSPFGQQLREQVYTQAGMPSPTSAPAASTSSAAAAPSLAATTPLAILTEGVATGAAITIKETPLYSMPGQQAELLETLPADTTVELLGQAAGQWVLIRPVHGIRPGWVDYRHLTSQQSPTPPGTPSDPAQFPTSNPAVPFDQLPPAPAALPTIERATTQPIGLPQAAAPERQLVQIQLMIIDQHERPFGGIRVQLVNGLGDRLADFRSAPDGQLQLQAEIWPGEQLSLQLPSAGVTIPLNTEQPTTTIRIPRNTASSEGQ
ncbi:MAG: hypothetical protein Fur005_22340 [Roseiflexaceae bacterium]